MNNKPLISIIVPIYNAEDTLNMCVDSLIYQTDDNFEIILIDKKSTDNSLEIIELYEQQFPTKITSHDRPFSPNSAAGRNFGIKQAKGDYIVFVDADDYVNMNMVKLLTEHVCSNIENDIVFYNYAIMKETEQIRVDRFKNKMTLAEAVCYDRCMCTFWNILWKKDFLESLGEINEVAAEDIVFIPRAISKVENFSICNHVLYYHNVVGGTTKSKTNIKMGALIEAWNLFLASDYNKTYENEIVTFLARRILIAIRSFERHNDAYIKWLCDNEDLFLNNPILKERKDVYMAIKNYIKNYIYTIPKNIYINGFSNDIDKDYISYLQTRVFNYEDASIFILNEKNCDINVNEVISAAYLEKDYDYVGHYFALKNIEEFGGFYLSDVIRITVSLNSFLVCDRPAVFSYLDDNTISEYIYGAVPNSKIIHSILHTYETEKVYSANTYKLYERMKQIFSIEYDLLLNGKMCKKNDFCLHSTDRMVLDLLNDQNMCIHSFIHHLNDDGYQLIKKTSLRDINQSRIINHNNTKLKNTINSDSWKFIKKVSEIDRIKFNGYIKKVFKQIIKFYRKVKARK